MSDYLRTCASNPDYIEACAGNPDYLREDCGAATCSHCGDNGPIAYMLDWSVTFCPCAGSNNNICSYTDGPTSGTILLPFLQSCVWRATVSSLWTSHVYSCSYPPAVCNEFVGNNPVNVLFSFTIAGTAPNVVARGRLGVAQVDQPFTGCANPYSMPFAVACGGISTTFGSAAMVFTPVFS